MRTPATVFRSAVVGAAAVALLAACGGDGEEQPAGSSSATSSGTATAPPSEPSATPDPAAAEFCAQVTAAFAEIEAALGTAGPAEVAGRLPEVVTTLETVEAPADIAADWNAMLDGLRQLATTAGSLDLTTPEGQQQFGDAEAQVAEQLAASQADLTGYVLANCEVSSATPTPS